MNQRVEQRTKICKTCRVNKTIEGNFMPHGQNGMTKLNCIKCQALMPMTPSRERSTTSNESLDSLVKKLSTTSSSLIKASAAIASISKENKRKRDRTLALLKTYLMIMLGDEHNEELESYLADLETILEEGSLLIDRELGIVDEILGVKTLDNRPLPISEVSIEIPIEVSRTPSRSSIRRKS